MSRFILFSLARTGSTTLMQVLNCHPGVKCVYEPFNPGNSAEYHHLVEHERKLWGLESAVEFLWHHCNGFKHVWHADGWPFREDPGLNHQLLRQKGVKVLLLGRRNLLQRAISVQISKQMQVWNTIREEDRRRIHSHVFGPLNVEQLRAEIATDGPLLDEARSVLVSARTTYRELWYEDFFLPETGMDKRLLRVQDLLKWLEWGEVWEPSRLAEMQRLFDPAVTGFQNAAAYRKIPNIEQVEEALGRPETGFVFDRR